MKVAVFGLWHLGCVTAGSLASIGYEVKCLDYDEFIVEGLNNGVFPIYEPGLSDLFDNNEERITFHTNPEDISDCDFLWVTFDTPVDDNDIADLDFVYSRMESVLNHVNDNCKVIISSQVPVGSTDKIENDFRLKNPTKNNVRFAYSPENLRLGTALSVFNDPDRIVVGISNDEDEAAYRKLIDTITDKSIWMKTQSAEMVKHYINAFLATCVVFTNEMSRVCEEHEVDIVDVEKGFRSESRIGTTLPLRSGMGFAGGTLARDVNFLRMSNRTIPLIHSLIESNDLQNEWCLRMIRHIFPDLYNTKIGIIGIAYKNDTNTLRRSVAYNLCKTLAKEVKDIYAFDRHIGGDVNMFAETLHNTVSKCDCIVIFSKHLNSDVFKDISVFKNKTILDPNGLYSEEFKDIPDCVYMRVGQIA